MRNDSSLTSRDVRQPETEGLILEKKTKTDCRLTELALYQNMPNPFSEQTFITFETPPGSEWHLRVERPDGEPVRTFEGNEGGRITLAWSGEDDAVGLVSGRSELGLWAIGLLLKDAGSQEHDQARPS